MAIGAAQDELGTPDQSRRTFYLDIASRILSSAVQQSSPVAKDDQPRLRLLAAAAFSLQGNHPSAFAILSKLSEDDLGSFSQFECFICAILSPRSGGQLRRFIEDPSLTDILDSYLGYFYGGDSSTLEYSRAQLVAKFQEPLSSFETVILGVAIGATFVAQNLGLIATIREYSLPISSTFADGLVAAGVLTLLPPQKEALTQSELLSSTGNALVTMPTSSGKTLLAEFLIMSTLQEEGVWACYVTPYVALGSQVVENLRERDSSIQVYPAMGGYISDGVPSIEGKRTIIVATPERFDSLIRNFSPLLTALRCVIFDEAHNIQSGSRGARLEGLITRLRIRQKSGFQFRIGLISAVLDDASEIVDWLGGSTVVHIHSNWRPTTRRIFYWRSNGDLLWIAENDSLRASAQPARSVLGGTRLPWPQASVRATEHFGAQRQQQPQIAENTGYLIRYLLERREGSVLCICAAKATTRLLALTISNQLSVKTELPMSISRILDLIDSRYPYLSDLARSVSAGVAYHNASLPSQIRQAIERAARAHELDVVVATTTLAEGVDLPFRYTVLHDWQMWGAGDGEQRPINPLLFRNIAGRSGRAGAHTDGDVFVWENPSGNYQYARSTEIWRSLIGSVVPQSSVTLASPLESDGSTSVTAMYASQFLAAIPENPDADPLEDLLSENSYSFRRVMARDRIMSELRRARSSILDERQGALGLAASPIRLTLLGSAALASGLSPETARRLASSLPRIDLESSLAAICASLIRALPDVPEQGNSGLQKKLLKPRTQYPIGPDDLEEVLRQWLAGREPLDIFIDLPYVNRSKRAGITEWSQGSAINEGWSAVFDKFTDFINDTCSNFLPWILRASESLSSQVPELRQLELFPWPYWARYVEEGIESEWGIELARRSASLSRFDAISFGERIMSVLDEDPDVWFAASRRSRQTRALNAFSEFAGESAGDEVLRILAS